MPEAQLIEARTKAEREQIEAEARAEETRLHAGAEADAARQRAAVAELYGRHPALLRLKELETLQALGENSQARLYVGFDRPALGDEDGRGA